MERSTSIKKIFIGNRINVPTYQRAYSWDTPDINFPYLKTHTDVFYKDLDDYLKSGSESAYYFGHFLFEEKSDCDYAVIDGQQRLTTIVIFLSSLFTRLKCLRNLTDDEEDLYEAIIIKRRKAVFSTVYYDNQLFIDYVLEQSRKNVKGLETESSKRIVKAFDYFMKVLKSKDEEYLLKMLKAVTEASCSTHPVKNESEAVQMFIFQNNRGKLPSNLEILKAKFMYNVHLHAGIEKDALIEEIKNRFETIYKSISSIEYRINEDDVLLYTLRVHFNSLWEEANTDKIDRQLAESNPIPFIKYFTNSLATAFEHLKSFLVNDEKECFEIHSFVTLGGFAIAIPFIIKAYNFNLEREEICKLCTSLESLILRQRIIGTRAELISRINEVYQKFTQDNPSIQPIIDKIEYIKNAPADSHWWAYWNKAAFESEIQGKIDRSTAKYLLWKYENHLESQGKKGYKPTRYDKIIKPHLEHIAPITENDKAAAGYGKYTESFKLECIDCLGNYLLLSAPHNESIGNRPFSVKLASYTQLAQQREIVDLCKINPIWNREKIEYRHDKIVEFILEKY